MINTSLITPGSVLSHTVMGGLCLALLVLTTAWHYEALRALGFVLARRVTGGRGRMPVVLLGIALTHALEVLAYAAAYYLMARHAAIGALGGSAAPSFNASLYFSLETYSSLGYGDIVPTGALRLLAGAEALNGLMLLGWSACYVHAVLGPFPAPGDGRTHDRDGQGRSGGIGFSTATRPAERRYSRRRAR
jgi:hypothetical protein